MPQSAYGTWIVYVVRALSGSKDVTLYASESREKAETYLASIRRHWVRCWISEEVRTSRPYPG